MKISKEFKIGLFVIVVLASTFFTLNYLKDQDLFDREIELSSSYEDLKGLVASAPVYIKGYKAGSVRSIEYDPSADVFNVTCSVKKDFAIPQDSKMTIYSVDIMGGKGVRIDVGESSVMVKDGAVLTPSFETDLLTGLGEGLPQLLSKVTQTMDSLGTTVSSVNRIMSDSNIETISRTLANLEKTMSEVSSLSGKINGRSDELDSFIVNLEDFSNKLLGMVDNLDKTMDNVADLTSSLSESDIKGLVDSFRSLAESLNDPDGSIGKLLQDSSVYSSVDSLLKDVDELVRKIQENPKKYIRISVF